MVGFSGGFPQKYQPRITHICWSYSRGAVGILHPNPLDSTVEKQY